jgi:VanZ family protein
VRQRDAAADPKPMSDRSVILVALAVGGILYGSLFPFAFHNTGSATDALVHLLSTWRQPPQNRGDLIANILFYFPLGLTLSLWLRPHFSLLALVAFASVSGGLLSVTMETSQFFIAGRVSTMSDVYLNTLGSCLGALSGSLVQRRLANVKFALPPGSSFIALLLLAWLGWRLFPYEPTIDLHKYWFSLKPLFRTPSLSTYDLYRFTLMWTCVGYLARRGLNLFLSSSQLAAGLLFVLLAKIFIVGLVITIPELLGLALATLLLQFEQRLTSATSVRLLAGLFVVFVVLERLQPWQFVSVARPFEWIPFYGFLHGSVRVDTQSFLQKFFFYGTLLWLLVKTGIRPSYVILFECSLLFATSLVQTHLAQRSGEIGDSVLAGLIGLIYVATSRSSASRARRGMAQATRP